MKSAILIKYAIPLIVGLILGLTINSWRYGEQVANLKADHAVELKLISDEAERASSEALAKQQAAEQSLADLDQKHTKELTDAQSENDRLRNTVADGTRRLRIAAKCPTDSPRVPEAAEPARMDNDGTVELDPAAGRSVFSIRAGMIQDQAKLRALQVYVRDVCLK